MKDRDVFHRPQPEELGVGDNNWLNLGQLRALVAKADELQWADNSLVSHTAGSQHIRRHDVRVARRIVIEGGPA